MPTAINSSNTSQDNYRAQAVNNQSGKQISSLANSLKASEKIAKAVGAETTGLQNALQRVSGNQEQTGASTKVSLSSEGVEKLKAERTTPAASQSTTTASTARPEKKQFGSVDEAIAYGASRAAEQANTRATDKTTKPNEVSAVASNSQVSSTNRPERKQFSSVDEAISYGASRAAEQSTVQSTASPTRTSEANSVTSQSESSTTSRADRRQFKSVDEAITYGAQRAVEQYSKQQLALGNATRGNA